MLHEVKQPISSLILGLEELHHVLDDALALLPSGVESTALTDLSELMTGMDAASHAVMSVLADALTFAKVEAGGKAGAIALDDDGARRALRPGDRAVQRIEQRVADGVALGRAVERDPGDVAAQIKGDESLGHVRALPVYYNA